LEVRTVKVNERGSAVRTAMPTITAIPYHSWANRGKNEMQLWLPVKIKDVKINY